ncbi:hypothetical protein RH858_15890 [Halalkaliarchaeum sp. AArc-GB]|uniref:hypothetical protein n=1 Tax=Halalkaliarchaeum sp. AArc-GB TaxID=3074078 RepID=UPI0028565CEF|nr:hypothetical protein [Halalkaliarchaeum sp. AArc-GB]MDR5674608.1 hypothetical protein [Halalkaliarchaeum sp. AArc-GB]
MNLGDTLVATGLAIVVVTLVFEYFSLQLSGMAVGAALVVIGFALLVGRTISDSSTDRQTCEDCGSANAPDATKCTHCNAAL